MASRIFHSARAASNGLVLLSGFVTVTSGGGVATATTEGRGVSVSTLSAGTYMFTLSNAYVEIQDVFCRVEKAGATELNPQCTARTTSTNKATVRIITGNVSKYAQAEMPSLTALSVTAETSVFVARGSAVTLSKVDIFVGKTAVTKDGANYRRFRLESLSADGSIVATQVATFSTLSTVGGTLTAWTTRAATVNTAALAQNRILRARWAIAGTGTATGKHWIGVTYSDARAASPGACKLHYLILCRNSTVK